MNNPVSPALPPLVLIAGPTASGKSALALALAEQSGGVIVNADSAQVYRDLRILSARPSPADEARAEHRLFGHVEGATAYSAAAWAVEARATIAEVHDAGRLPIVVGGTGMYIRTLLDGIAPMPAIDAEVRRQVRALPVALAHAALAQEDPPAAARLPQTDTTRVARALEVVRATGRPIAAWRERRHGGIGDHVRLIPRVILPERETLYARCDARFAALLDAGAADEVAALLARRLDTLLPVMRAIGVREVAAWLGGQTDRTTALAAGAMATRRYAKRQLTWLRHQIPSAWPQLNDTADVEIVIKLRQDALTR